MKHYETESLIKAFSIYFLTLFMASMFASYMYCDEQHKIYCKQLVLEMESFSYSRQGDGFCATTTQKEPSAKLKELVVTPTEAYALFPDKNESAYLKIAVPYSKYKDGIREERLRAASIFAIMVLSSIVFAAFFALFALSPLRKALRLMENFLKDIIHDINTPVTSISLNAQILNKKYGDEEIERIKIGSKTISSLSKNLEALYREIPLEKDNIHIKAFLEERVGYYSVLYPNISFNLEAVKTDTLAVNKDVLLRLIDNLISNACKYNKPYGSVNIKHKDGVLSISDTGVGIKDVKKCFDRFYKESERGLGIGLHIVKTLSQKINADVRIESEIGIGTTVTVIFSKQS